MNFEILTDENLRYASNIMAVVIFFGLFIWTGNIILNEMKAVCMTIVNFYRKLFVDLPRRRRSKDMIKKARALGCVWTWNSERALHGVCLTRDFKLEMARVAGKIQDEKPDEAEVTLALSPLQVMPDTIITFADRDECGWAVTGTTSDMERFGEDLVFFATGYSRSQVNKEDHDYVKRILSKRDKRLMVPFVREGELRTKQLLPSLKEQVKLYGGKSLDFADKYLRSFQRS
jgi:hypothetical protein